jgi:Na+-driven multidrug efflux pump
VGLLFLLGIYAYFAFRPDSSFANYTSLPRGLWKAANAVDYRNFWAFGLLGLYVAAALGVSWLPWKSGRIRWGTIGLLLLPVLKESLQNLVHGRHGNVFGASQGLAGIWVGLMAGNVCRWLWAVLRARKLAGVGKEVRPQPERSGDGP